jgi:hypothetical protein
MLQKKSATIGGTRDVAEHFSYTLAGAGGNLSRASSGSSLSDFSSSLSTPEGMSNFRKGSDLFLAKEEFQRGSLSAAAASVASAKKATAAKTKSLAATVSISAPQPIGSNLRKASLQDCDAADAPTPFVFNRDPFLPGSNIGEALFTRQGSVPPLHLAACEVSCSGRAVGSPVALAPVTLPTPLQHQPQQSQSPWHDDQGAQPVMMAETRASSPAVVSAGGSTAPTGDSGLSPIWTQPPFPTKERAEVSVLPGSDSIWASRLVSPQQPLVDDTMLPGMDEPEKMSSIWDRAPSPSPVGTGSLTRPGPGPPQLYESFASASITDLWNPTASIFPGAETPAWAEYQKRRHNLPIAPFDQN